MRCPVCGHANNEGASLCENCGAVISEKGRSGVFRAVAKLFAVAGLYFGAMFAATYFWMIKYMAENGRSFTEAEYFEAFNRDSGYVNLIFCSVCVLGAALFYKIKNRSLVNAANIYPAPPFKIGTALVCGFAAQIPLGVIMGLIPFSEEILQGHDELINSSTTPMAVQVIYVVVLAPVIEEIFFRGIAHDRLSRAMHPVLASVISSVLFALIHGELVSIIAAFAAGMLLSLLYNRYRTVLVPIAFHVGFNVLAYVVPFVEGFVMEIVAVSVSTVLFMLGIVILLKKDKTKKSAPTK